MNIAAQHRRTQMEDGRSSIENTAGNHFGHQSGPIRDLIGGGRSTGSIGTNNDKLRFNPRSGSSELKGFGHITRNLKDS